MPQEREDPPDPPRAKDLDALLGEIGETLGDVEELPPLSPPREPWPGWKVWTVAGAVGCAGAGAIAAGNPWTPHGLFFSYAGLPVWTWGAINGALVGSLSGPACLIWERVRRGSLKGFQGVGLIVLMSAAALALASFLISNVISLVADQRLYLPPPQSLLASFWLNLVYGCALAGGVLSHVGRRGLVSRLFFSWALCMAAYLPILLVGARLFPYMADMEFFWRGGFPYYLSFPLSWWAATRFAPDPLPVLRGGEKSSDDA